MEIKTKVVERLDRDLNFAGIENRTEFVRLPCDQVVELLILILQAFYHNPCPTPRFATYL